MGRTSKLPSPMRGRRSLGIDTPPQPVETTAQCECEPPKSADDARYDCPVHSETTAQTDTPSPTLNLELATGTCRSEDALHGESGVTATPVETASRERKFAVMYLHWRERAKFQAAVEKEENKILIMLAHNTTGTKADGTSDYDVELRVNDRVFSKLHVEKHVRSAGAAELLRKVADGLDKQEAYDNRLR